MIPFPYYDYFFGGETKYEERGEKPQQKLTNSQRKERKFGWRLANIIITKDKNHCLLRVLSPVSTFLVITIIIVVIIVIRHKWPMVYILH